MNGQSMIQNLILKSNWKCLNNTINLNSKFNRNFINPLKFQQKNNLFIQKLNTNSLLLNNSYSNSNNNDLLCIPSYSSLNISKTYLYQYNNISKKYYSTSSNNNNNNDNNNNNNEEIKSKEPSKANAKPENYTTKDNRKKDNNKDNKNKGKGYRPNPVISFVFFIVGASAGSFLAHTLFDILDELRRAYRENKLSSVGGNKVLKDDDDSDIPSPNDPELTPAMVTRFLRKNEFTTFSNQEEKSREIPEENETTNEDNSKSVNQETNTSVIGYENNFVNSNNPIEDQHTQAYYKDKLIFGVYDGHSGTECGKVVASQLHNYIASALDKTKLPKIPENPDNDSTIDNKRKMKIEERINKMTEAIKRAFVNLDKDIINGNVNFTPNEINDENEEDIGKIYTSPLDDEEIVKKQMKTALSGACALVAIVDNETDDLYVACTGDSRAVLGRKIKNNQLNEGEILDKDYKYEAIPLSIDQTLRNADEVKRMEKEHPNENETMFIRNRVLGGLMPTRTFGDSRYKWSSKVQKSIVTPKFINRRPLPFYYTPPYITAEPVVTCHPLTEEDQFLVMATDGIWDELSNEDVVNLIAQHLEEKNKSEPKRKINETKYPPSLLIEKKTAEEMKRDRNNLIISERKIPAILKDSNAATHVIRNALGGSDDKYISDLLTIPSPKCRNYRDDMTVTIIYFDKEKNKPQTEKLDISKHFIQATPKYSSKKNLLNEWVKYANKN
ncbi:protein serine/threonine phosphatase 2C [Anaeromyces robustus]|uniref:Protein serine/threonine phosphatase 2C n=1 Tax=Anaeromyces robustus TaxID=1754192 RepID=A0A1Y1WUT2_9FUNG|nr:protein serine/threonine phosphatase 2C [Anaeromyces robustus]|eukprot:ORX77311.1 protein serine/threonine phosphatase 2C [Anaeromyces robustus]